ncbi:MAG: AbrB/MazE/SpoVT family DNA-binding domain-containing protein [Bryobacteraceae bacterium]|nr:AbrB/MazE/SpoVT family DNA-binding domain-containing protein [Bryobacteraceae bacterium]
MPKMTSKYQVTVPKAIADRYGIRPGDEIAWVPAGDAIRVIPASLATPPGDSAEKLRLFDEATERHRRRGRRPSSLKDRGWKREDLYGSGGAR